MNAGYLSVRGTASTMAGSFRHLIQPMFHGSIVALLTPFDADGGIDYAALEKLVNFHLESGTDALVVAGTTGESATLEQAEYEALLAAAIRLAGAKIPVIAGTGSASTHHAISQSKLAESLGASGVLVVTPYYNRPTQAGLLAHYRAIADAVSVPVILYNVPSRTAVDLEPETAIELASHPIIVGIKEAVADIDRIGRLVRDCPPDFSILSGDDPTCLDAMRAGAKGVISVAANVAPVQMSGMCRAVFAQNWNVAESINESLGLLYETMALETNPIPVKWAAFEMGLIGPDIRLPLTALAENHRVTVTECLETLADSVRGNGPR